MSILFKRQSDTLVFGTSHCLEFWTFGTELFLGGSIIIRKFLLGCFFLEIGAVNEHNQLVIHTKYNTPTIFSRFRGSSLLCASSTESFGALRKPIYLLLILTFGVEFDPRSSGTVVFDERSEIGE